MRARWTQFHTNMKSSFAVGVTEHRSRLPKEAVKFPSVEILRPRLDAYPCDCGERTSARVGLDDLPLPVTSHSPRVPMARAAPNAYRRPPTPATNGTRMTGRRARALGLWRRRRMSGSTGDRARARGGRGCSWTRGAGRRGGGEGSRCRSRSGRAGWAEPRLPPGPGRGDRWAGAPPGSQGGGVVCVAPRCRPLGRGWRLPGCGVGRPLGRCGGPAGVGRAGSAACWAGGTAAPRCAVCVGLCARRAAGSSAVTDTRRQPTPDAGCAALGARSERSELSGRRAGGLCSHLEVFLTSVI